ncbi:LPXTG-motif protein cell wall anchor domain protein [Enterococcus lactis]|uniref:BspA family leucine-rich repeat surface protein n=1 Tax=Enterococcus lactis TaxID=357441 RepID=UPI00192C1ED5|nr:BspA family leucine-rich repeat surface protein [Enterococcus lactis]MBL5005991.1 LPXTG-motif protein cell wall anchor domain protein [Enterococcus lactis]MBL5011812.1 LPXTG-motif protein cell wall anchor domain protein [Enterococcus lactis]
MNKKKQPTTFGYPQLKNNKKNKQLKDSSYLQGVAALILIFQIATASLAPVYQVAAQTSTTTTTASTVEKPDTTGSSTVTSTMKEASTQASSSSKQSESTESTETADSIETSQSSDVGPDQLKRELVSVIAGFGDTTGVSVTIEDKKIIVDLTSQLSKQVDAIKTAVTPKVPAGYEITITALDATVTGTFGTAPWSLTDDGTLHIGAGVFSATTGTGNSAPWTTTTYASKVKKIIFDGNVTADSLSSGLFQQLTNLQTIEGLGKLDVSKVTDMSRMFWNDRSLISLDVSSWKVDNVQNMQWMFYLNNSLTSLEVSNWKVNNVTNMNSMFGGTTNLTQLDVKNWVPEKVADFSFMFADSGVQSLDFSNWTTAKVITTNMFYRSANTGPSKLTKVTFDPNMNLTVSLPVQTGYNWYYLSDTGNIDLTKQLSSGKYVSGTSTNGTYVIVNPTLPVTADIKYLPTDSTTPLTTQTISGTVGQVKQVTVLDPWTSAELKGQPYVFAIRNDDLMSAFSPPNLSVTLSSDTTDDKSISLQPVIAKGIFGTVKWYMDEAGTLHIGSGTFADSSGTSPWQANSSNIKNIIFEGNVTAATDSRSLFDGLNNVVSIKGLDKLDVKNIENAKRMFADMKSLKEIGGLSNWSTGNVTNMSEMFNGASALNSLDFTNWNTSNVTNMDQMLSGMSALQKITFGSGFVTSQAISNSVGQVDLPNDTTTIQWQSVAGGSVEAPLGMTYVGSYDSAVSKPDTYVLANVKTDAVIKYVDAVTGTEIASETVTGAVGDKINYNVLDPWKSPELKDKLYVFTATAENKLAAYSHDPVSLTLALDSSDDQIIQLQEVKAKGINGEVKWYIDRNNALHLGPGIYGIGGWQGYKDTITSIEIEGKIKLFDPYAYKLFYEFINVTSITGLDNMDVSAVTDMQSMFSRDYKLKSLDLSSWDTSNVTNMSSMFENLSSLEILDLSTWDTSNVTDMSRMFAFVQNIEDLDISGFDTHNVKNMQSMFIQSALKTLDLGTWDTSNVTDMSGMMGFMPKLEKINLGTWETQSVETTSVMFFGDSTLTELNLSFTDTPNLKDISNMLTGMTNLSKLIIGKGLETSNIEITASSPNKSMDLPNTQDEGVWQNIGNGTEENPAGDQMITAYDSTVSPADTYFLLKQANVDYQILDYYGNPQPLVTDKTVLGKVGGTVSYEVQDPWKFDDLKKYPIVFAGDGLAAFDYDPTTNPDLIPVQITLDGISQGHINIKPVFYNLITDPVTGARSFVSGKGIFGDVKWYIDPEGILHIGSGTFADTNGKSPWADFKETITGIIFEGNVKAGADSSLLFSDLPAVKGIQNMDRLDVSGVTNMAGMFENSPQLTSLDLSTWEVSNVENMQTIFQGTTNLTDLNIKNWDVDQVTNMGGAFASSGLSNLDLTGWNTAKATDHSGMFADMTNLKQITFDKGFDLKVELPNTTDTLKWRNLSVADGGTVEKPAGTNFFDVYDGEPSSADTYVLGPDDTQIASIFPNTGSNFRLYTLISASFMIILSLFGLIWFRKTQAER